MNDPDATAVVTTFGLLVPYFNSAVEPELAALRPAGVTHQTARFVLSAQVLDDITGTAEKLQACGVDAFLVGIAPDNVPGGLALMRQGSARIADATGLPVYTASLAVAAGLQALGAEIVSVVTPFDDASNLHVAAALESQGFHVSAIVGLARPALNQIANTPRADLLDAFARADTPAAQALVQVGTGLPLSPLLPALEQRFGKPVVASNAALYWQALRGSGRLAAIDGAGRLLAEH